MLTFCGAEGMTEIFLEHSATSERGGGRIPTVRELITVLYMTSATLLGYGRCVWCLMGAAQLSTEAGVLCTRSTVLQSDKLAISCGA